MSTIRKVASTGITVVIVILAVLMMYLGLTSLPIFLGLSGIYFPSPGTEAIADGLARLFLVVVCIVGAAGLQKLQNRIEGDTE